MLEPLGDQGCERWQDLRLPGRLPEGLDEGPRPRLGVHLDADPEPVAEGEEGLVQALREGGLPLRREAGHGASGAC